MASGTTLLVPPSVDQIVLTHAQERFAEIRRQRSTVQRAWWISAAAAVFVALAFVTFSLVKAPRYERADIDRSGHVDILDAFALARRIQQGTASDFDFNKDGVVDKFDVDMVAARAVSLKKGSV